jgi:hypothetical protein
MNGIKVELLKDFGNAAKGSVILVRGSMAQRLIRRKVAKQVDQSVKAEKISLGKKKAGRPPKED